MEKTAKRGSFTWTDKSKIKIIFKESKDGRFLLDTHRRLFLDEIGQFNFK